MISPFSLGTMTKGKAASLSSNNFCWYFWPKNSWVPVRFNAAGHVLMRDDGGMVEGGGLLAIYLTENHWNLFSPEARMPAELLRQGAQTSIREGIETPTQMGRS